MTPQCLQNTFYQVEPQGMTFGNDIFTPDRKVAENTDLQLKNNLLFMITEQYLLTESCNSSMTKRPLKGYPSLSPSVLRGTINHIGVGNCVDLNTNQE